LEVNIPAATRLQIQDLLLDDANRVTAGATAASTVVSSAAVVPVITGGQTPADNGAGYFTNFAPRNKKFVESFPEVWRMSPEMSMQAIDDVEHLFDDALLAVAKLITTDIFPRFKRTALYHKGKATV
jgi:hypothetical protein